MQLNQAIKGRDALAATTGEAGVAPYRADGLYDQRRKPFPAMRKAIEQMTKAVQNKDEKMWLLALDAIGVDSEVVEAAEEAQRLNHKLR